LEGDVAQRELKASVAGMALVGDGPRLEHSQYLNLTLEEAIKLKRQQPEIITIPFIKNLELTKMTQPPHRTIDETYLLNGITEIKRTSRSVEINNPHGV
jgi:hypothetical protein